MANLLNKTFLPGILFLLLFGFMAAAQEKTVTYYADPASTPADLPVKLTHITAQIRFVPEENRVEGSADFTLTRNRISGDPLIFFTPDFTIASVRIDGHDAAFTQSGTQLSIAPDLLPPSESVESRLQIVYTALPMKGNPYFIGWRQEESGKRKQIWAHRPHGWIPYMDARITMDMFFTFDSNYMVFSNGERIAVTANPDGTKTWHYAMKKDHPFFSTALVIGDYDYKPGKTRSGVPLEFWYYPEMPDRLATTYLYTERMFDFLEQELRFPYPYPLYREAPVIDYMYAAMETTTSTIFGDYLQITPRSWWQRNYVNVNVHELSHQWFGNYVAHLVNRDVWLTESFATFYAKRFEKQMFGEDYWQNLRNDEMSLAFEAARQNNYPVGGTQGGNQRIYMKGSLVLEMLQHVMGEQEFREAVNLYLNRYGHGYAETNDFIRCTYDASGKSWFWFFDQWILRGGEPHYHVTDSSAIDPAGVPVTVFRVRQIQPVSELTGLFRMPFRFEVHYTDGSYDSAETWIAKQETMVTIPDPSGKTIDYTLFDPGRTVLKKVTYPQSPARWMNQALKAAQMIDRYDALVSLRTENQEMKRETLIRAWSGESFHLTKSEILAQLSSDTSDAAMKIKVAALSDNDALVRYSALMTMGKLPEIARPAAEQLLYDSSFANVERALDLLCRSYPQRIAMYLEQTKTMEGWRGKNIRMKWLEIAIAAGNRNYLDEVISYCGPQFEFETRMNAFRLLKDLGYYDDRSRSFAESASGHWNSKLSSGAKSYLKAAEGLK